MKEIEVFYLTGCPYCHNARRAVEELKTADPSFTSLPLRWIDESRERELADSRDYYYVPTMYIDGVKQYECAPGQNYEVIRENIRRVFEQALSEN